MLATGQVLAQSKAVSGTVKSQQGEPLTGVTILIEGTTQGTSTDAQGAFTLQAKPDDMLAVSYLGYKSQRVKVGTRTKLEVVLTEDQNLMDEVVVVGYGTQRRRNIVGAVENISGEVLENRPNAYLLRSIQGQIPGVNITMADGKPSRSASINIRANTQSIGAGGSALCLIDGVEGDLTAMNPEDVESISVLKDASSTAVYGARGAFGVVLVTTKSARKDKISVDYSGSVSIISETVRPKYETDSQTWYDNYMTAYVGYSHHLPTGINNFFPWTQSWEDEYKKRMNDPDRSYLEWELDASGKYQYYGRNTDWYDLFYKKSTTAHQHNIRISGGGKTSSFIASARYYEQDGIYRVGDEKFRQLNARAKGTVNITKWLTVENNTDFVRRSYHQPTTYAQNLLVRRNLEHQGFPITRVTNPDGTWTAAAVYTGYANMAEGNSYRDNLKFDMKNTTVVTIDLIKDVLVAKADYSYLFNHSRQNDVISQVTYSNGPGIQISYPASSSMRTTETQIEYHSGNANLSFTPRLPEDHSLNVMAGWNIEHKRARNTRMGRDGFIVDGKPNYSLMNGIDYVLEDANSYDWGFVGIFYRASYAYKGKYLAELSGRYDGQLEIPEQRTLGLLPVGLRGLADVGGELYEGHLLDQQHQMAFLDRQGRQRQRLALQVHGAVGLQQGRRDRRRQPAHLHLGALVRAAGKPHVGDLLDDQPRTGRQPAEQPPELRGRHLPEGDDRHVRHRSRAAGRDGLFGALRQQRRHAHPRFRGFAGLDRQFPCGEQTLQLQRAPLALGQHVDHHQIHQQVEHPAHALRQRLLRRHGAG